jgi:hypothetical protein
LQNLDRDVEKLSGKTRRVDDFTPATKLGQGGTLSLSDSTFRAAGRGDR